MKQIFTFTASALLLASCQQIDLGDKISSVVAQDDTYSVKITSKSGDSNVDIPMPLTIYAVNADGLVEKRASVTEEGATSVNLSLVSGDYTFYAIAGADAGNDDVPENNMVTAENGYFTKPVMRCTKNATVDDETELPMTLSYAVAAVDFTLNNISSDVKAVSVKLGALRESMNLAGEYAGTTTATLDLTKQSDGTTWKSAVAYVFPSVSAPTTLTITQTMTDDTKQSYTASYNAKLLAGTPYHFKGTGTSISNHDLTVNVTAETWDNAIDEELVLTPSGAGDGTGSIDADGETFLVSAMPTESGIEFEGHVLAYLDGDKGLLYAKQDCTQDQIAEYSEGDITGWSVPTLEQYNNIKSQATLLKLNNAIKSLTNNALPFDGHYYYCGDCSIAFSWLSNANNGQVAVGNSNKTYHLRLVKEVTFKLKD
ncbi:MAG: hypothetical protein J6P01_01805 [Prevotella sp.]|nr:hypothetical protein [Prevotella sp.]